MLQNRYNYYLFVCIAIILGNLFSQNNSISGWVIDYETNKPIKDVSIYIKQSNLRTSSDEEGYFDLYVCPKCNISIDEQNDIKEVVIAFELIGYENKVINFSDFTNQTKIFLNKQSIELKSIHVHDEYIHQRDILLDSRKIDENIRSNLANTLSYQPNIGVISFGSVTSKPIIRGLSGDRFLLTKDGMQMGDLSQTAIDHVISLDITEVSNIELIRGPRALFFGSNPIGGVLNTSIIGDPKARVDKFYKNIKIGGESFNNSLYGNLVFFIPIKNNQLNVYVNNRDTKNQTSPIGTLENTYSITSNYKVGFTHYQKQGYINFVIESFNMDYGIPPSAEGHISGVDIVLNKNTFQINTHQDISFGKFNQLDFRYNFIDYEHKEFENNVDFYSVSLAKNTHNFKFEIFSEALSLGAELDYKDFIPAGFYWTPNTDETNFSIYAYLNKKYKNYDLLGSFRFGHIIIDPKPNYNSYANLEVDEIIKRTFSYFSTSIGFKKESNKLTYEGWFIQTMRPPKIEELYSDGPHLGTYSYEIGEPNLDLEKIYGLESVVMYDSNPFNISLTNFLNYSPYYYQMTKMGECEEEMVPVYNEEDGTYSYPCSGPEHPYIEWGSGPGWLYMYDTKGVEALIMGFEFSLNYTYHHLNIDYDFSYVIGENLSFNEPLSYMNPAKHILNIGYDENFLNYKLRLSKIQSQNRLGEFESYTPGASLIDLIVSYRNKRQTFTLQLNNILDETHYNHLSKIKFIAPEPGRNLVISYKLLF